MRTSLVLIPILMTLAACSTEPQAPVTDAKVRLPAVSGRPGAAYFTLHGGGKGRTLVSVSSSQAGRAEMHDMSMSGGMMRMAPITSGLPVPKGEQVRFEPGGKHVMLFSMQSGLKPGDRISLSFTFADGETARVEAPAEAAGGADEQAH